jgi:hypothetical protein
VAVPDLPQPVVDLPSPAAPADDVIEYIRAAAIGGR